MSVCECGRLSVCECVFQLLEAKLAAQVRAVYPLACQRLSA